MALETMTLFCSTSYDRLASNYDAIGLAQCSVPLAELVSTLYNRRGFALDLCCGTGLAAETLARQGWKVTGVDQSVLMLDIARARSRDSHSGVRYIQDDIRDLEHVRGKFDLISCFGDSLAELSEEADLFDCFRGMKKHLKAEGIVAFDLRRKSLYERWDASSEVLHDDQGLLAYVERDYVSRDGLASNRYVCFLRESDLWWREETTIDTRYYSDTALNDALAHAGFKLIERLNMQGKPAAEDEEWVLFVSSQ